GGGGAGGALAAVVSKLRHDRRNDLVEVADDGPVCARDDRGALVVVDHQDPLGALTADDVLDRAADAARDVEVGRNSCTGLPDLVGMRSPAEVRDDARAADGTSEEVRKLLENLKPLLPAAAAAA